MAYDFHGRRFCSGSNTVPSMSECAEAVENSRKFQCQECGRTVTLRATGLVPTHLAKEPK